MNLFRVVNPKSKIRNSKQYLNPNDLNLKKFAILEFRILLVVIALNLGFLHNGYGQSFFSMKGFGEEILYKDARASSLGGLIGLSKENPAFPLQSNKTEFSGTIVSNFVYGQESGNSRMIYDIRPLMINGKIPLPYKFCIGFKLSEYFNQNFNIYSDSIQFSNYWTRRHIVGQGGIYGASVSLARSLFKEKISCGIEYSKLLGRSSELWYFEVLNGNYITLDSVLTTYSASRLCFGLFANLSYFTIGVMAEDILTGKINSEVISHGMTVDSVNGLEFNMPYGFGTGIIFDKFAKTKFYLDGFYRNWEKATIADTVISRFNNSMKYSLTVEHWLTDYHPLRVGLRYYSTYLSDYVGIQIKEYALTCGSNVPIAKFGSLAYSLEIIRRQGKEVKETIGRLSLSLFYEEAWKKRTRRWGY